MRAGLFTPPPEIATFHKELLAALGVDYFPPGMSDVNAWRNFLFVLDTLKASAGGALAGRDIRAVVNLMRQQNREKRAGWSLRFGKIMGEPEAFRDLVLESRRALRPRAPIETAERVDATGARLQIERDPAAEAEPAPVSEAAERFMREYRERQARKAQP